MAAQTATLHNPAIRALFRRQKARGKRGDVALGHCMRKLLHLVFAVWKTGRAFDPKHYPWEGPVAPKPVAPKSTAPPSSTPFTTAPATTEMAAGHTEDMLGALQGVPSLPPHLLPESPIGQSMERPNILPIAFNSA